MKKLSVFLLAILLLLNTTSVYATEVQVRTKVNIKATVPADFSDSIRIALTNSNTGEEVYRELLKNENYEGSLSVLGGFNYEITIIFNNQQNYSVLGISDNCFINGSAFSLRFNVVKNDVEEESTFLKEEDVTLGEENTSKQTMSNNVNNSTIDTEIIELYTKAIEKMTIYYNSRELNPYIKQNFEGLSIYNKERHIKELCKHIGVENYNNVTPIDTFVYVMLYEEMLSAERFMTSEEKFIDYVSVHKSSFDCETDNYGTREITDGAYKAIYAVWEWVYNYHTQTGIIYDFYKNENIPYVKHLKERLNVTYITSESEPSTLHSQDEIISVEGNSEEKDTGNEVNEQGTNKKNSAWDNVIGNLKNNIVTIVILLVVGIFLIVFYVKNKRKN